MKISIVGTGYVGIVSGACFAEIGNEIICVDVVKEKVELINSGKSPIFEPQLEEMIARNLKQKRLRATLDLQDAVKNSEITFICVGTPPQPSGETDLSYIYGAAEGIGKALKEKKEKHVVVVKSTVPPGTSERVAEIVEKQSGKKRGKEFGVCMTPEFLREGNAVYDFMNPDRTVIGGENAEDIEKVASLFARFKAPIVKTNLRTAEMIKYASNAFLATKISYINEIASICEKLGIDVYEVADGAGFDKRVGRAFLNAGAGWGGSCFGKDVKSLVFTAKKN
ncbi:MAG: nucleotide sugar dehydrogenase, partial [Candidatus Micrarchaeota archaeon]